jgi:snRNA-activating protein complex subunit 2
VAVVPSSQQLVSGEREGKDWQEEEGFQAQALPSPHSFPFPPLPESAVVLDLLMSLPEELPRLPCTALAEHMAETYARLMAPQPSPHDGSPRPGAEDGGPGIRGPEEPGQVTPQASEPRELKSTWQAAGICPLNPFLVPLKLLGRVATPAR